MSIAYQVGNRIASNLHDWDVVPTNAECIKVCENELWNFDEQDWKDFFEGVNDARRKLKINLSKVENRTLETDW